MLFRSRIRFQGTIEAAPADADEGDLRRQVGQERIAALLVVSRQGEAASAELLVPSGTSPRHTAFLQACAEEAVVRARVAAAGQPYERLRDLMRTDDVRTARVSPEGTESREQTELRMLVPLGFMLLLYITIFTSANYLLTTTIEIGRAHV